MVVVDCRSTRNTLVTKSIKLILLKLRSPSKRVYQKNKSGGVLIGCTKCSLPNRSFRGRLREGYMNQSNLFFDRHFFFSGPKHPCLVLRSNSVSELHRHYNLFRTPPRRRGAVGKCLGKKGEKLQRFSPTLNNGRSVKITNTLWGY